MGSRAYSQTQSQNIANLNAFLTPTGPSDAATASLRKQRALDWAAFVANNSPGQKNRKIN